MPKNEDAVESQVPELRVPDLSELLALDDSEEAWIEFPDHNFKVKVRSLSKAEQIKYRKQATVNGKVDGNRLEGLLLVNGLVQPKLTIDHINTMFQKKSGLVDKILLKILDLSGMTDDKREEAEADFPGEW